ncbi:MAG: long-chain fatty acid--CoA ligase [Opitutus sp.]|nr:long-chain fatty acid--CoA ligase [Opitutus sp.]
MNLATHLARVAVTHRDRPALAVGENVVATWAQLADRVARLAGGLTQQLGLVPGDRVGLFLANAPACAELMYACWHAGLIAVPINSKLHPRELAFILENADARVVFTSPSLAGSTATAAAGVGRSAHVIDAPGTDYDALFQGAPLPMADVAPADLAWLFYTSGTTGNPKGAMLSHRNLHEMALSYFLDIDSRSSGGCLIHAAPMSHGSGLYMIPHVMQANCQVIPESGGFDPAELFALIEKWPDVSLFAAPTMIKRLVDHPAAASADLRNLRVIVYGGAPMHVVALKAAIERFGFKFAQLYGQGETPMTITGMRREAIEAAFRADDEARLASAGTPQAVVEVRVADAQDRALPAGEPGEILVRGDTVMQGYWRNPAATAESLRGGWLHTGDIGVFDAAGYLTLKDRSKDFIISGGSNIYPREVEEILLRHPAVGDAAVIGVPDEEWGESVCAFVVVRPGASVTAAELDHLCLENLARFKRPKTYRFVAHLPKSNYGKVLKTELRQWAKTKVG